METVINFIHSYTDETFYERVMDAFYDEPKCTKIMPGINRAERREAMKSSGKLWCCTIKFY
jgi:hypothetical protein